MANEKKNLNSSPGISELFGMENSEQQSVPDEVASSPEYAEKTQSPPADLPIANTPELPGALEPIGEPKEATDQQIPDDLRTMPDLSKPSSSRTVGGIFRTLLPYVGIFVVGLILYTYYFSNFSFQSLFNDTLRLESLTSENRDSNLEQIKSDVEKDYNVWIGQFFVDVNDASIISMDADVSGNGLSNLEKYLLNLNPKVYSTQGSVGDGQMVIEGINPWTGKIFTAKQKELVDKYIYKELISNRITAAAITRGVTKFSQYVTEDSPYYIDPETLQEIGSNRSVIVNPPQIPTDGGNATPAIPTTPAVSSSPDIRPEQGINTSVAGLLEIPANNISVPLIWTKEVKDFDVDLKKGIVHYPGTALPGEVGLTYLSGHSSGYIWDKSPYKQIFASLGKVADGTSFTITVTQSNGQKARYNYVVTGRGEFAANDQAQFVSTADSQVALSTCWPVGTVDRRLVLYAKLTQTERL